MDPFSVATGLAGLISLAMELTTIIKGYVGDYKSAPEDAHNLLVEITSLCHVLRQFTAFLRTDFKGRLEATSALIVVIRSCQEEIEGLFKKLEKLKGGGKMKELLERMKWPLKKEEYQSTVEMLHRFMQTFQFSLTIANCEILSKSTDDVMAMLEQKQEKLNVTISVLKDQMEDSMAEIVAKYKKQTMMLGCVMEALLLSSKTQNKILKSMEELHDRFDVQEMEDLLKWISPLEPQIRHQDIRSKRLGNTGQWFVELAEFQKWRDDSEGTNLFGVYGIPGAGKTVMSSLVVDHLSSRYSGKNVCVACLHFDYQETESQSLINVVGGILKQALSSARNLPNTIIQPLVQMKKARKKIELENALQALAQVLQTFDAVFICIDALDECEEDCRWSLLESLQQLTETSESRSSRIKFFFTGRPEMEEYVNTHTSFEESNQIAVTLEANSDDIVEYIKYRFSRDKRVKMTQEFKDQIVSEIISKSLGMFLLPVLQISSVLEKTTVKRRREALKTMPRGLNDAFRLTIERVKSQTSDIAEQALNILKWIFLAERPLTLEELRHALATEPGLEELDEEDFIDPKSIFEGCFGLVTMDKATCTLRLVHKSLQDYLDTQYDEGQMFQGGHGEIALACLTYISFDIPNFIHLAMEEELFRTYALLEYAFYNWGNHARKEKTQSIPSEIVNLLLETHDSRPFFQRLLTWPIRRNFGEDKQYLTAPQMQIGENDIGSQNLALVVAAFFGAESVVRELVDCQDIDVNAQDAGERVALSWAAGRGYIAIVELLVHHEDIEIDIKDMGGLTPLAIAAKAGHHEVVRVLLERNADVNTKDNSGRTALSLATRGGHTEVVRMLLDAGAVVDPEDANVRTTLSIAAYEKHTDILELLLERGANIKAKGKYDRNPLSYAVDIGCEEIVRALLDRGGDVDEKDSRGRTAVSLAAESGWQDILSLLVERGFSIDERDNNGRTPLSYAAGVVYRDTRFYNGHVEYKHGGVLEILLKNGAEVNCKDNLGRTPLSWAAQAGHVKTISTLLERGADINSQDLQGRTPLIWSVVTDTESYSDDIVRLLLDHKDVDVNLVEKNHGMTALEWAEDLGIDEAEDMLRAFGSK